MSIEANIIKKQNEKIFSAKDLAVEELISISIRLEQLLHDQYIGDFAKYEIRDANECIKKAVARINPVRSLSDLLGE